MYCGDETGSFIGEIGSHTCRFGYGGEDNPKLTMPSYVVSSGKDGTSQSRKMSRFSSLHPPKDEETMESILRMPEHYLGEEPLTDPNAFLRQGEVVASWDNWQTAWEHGMDTLRATDTLKHTAGGTPYDRTKKQKREHQSGATSATVVGKEKESSNERGRCIHPLLAIAPGVSEYTAPTSDVHDAAVLGPNFTAATKRREYTRCVEVLMESLDATSAFVAPAPMLAAFSLGRQTALVVDVGASGTTVTPVVDGLVLKQSQRRSGRGGDWLGHVAWKALLEENHRKTASSPTKDPASAGSSTTIKPRYMLLGNHATKYEGKKLSSVFHQRAMNDLMYELRTEPFVGVPNREDFLEDPTFSFAGDGDVTMATPPTSPEKAATAASAATPTVPGTPQTTTEGAVIGDGNTYELPDGTKVDLKSNFGRDLSRLPELLFADEAKLPFRNATSTTIPFTANSTLSNLPLHKLIRESLLAVGDVDVRKELAGTICLVGATALIPNLDKRLSQELTALLPSFVKPKVVASKVASVERSCASWIGASILTSLGSFQQLWLSRTEYEEYGATLSIQRFP